MKNELKFLAWTALCTGLPSGIIKTFSINVSDIWTDVGVVLFLTWSWTVPCYLALRNQPPKWLSMFTTFNSSDKKSSSRSQREGDSVSTSEAKKEQIYVASSGQYVPFKSSPKIATLMEDDAARSYIEEFLLHFQLTSASNSLLLWYNIQKYREADEDALTGKSWLLYQKFIDKNAYIYIDCIGDFTRDKLKDKIMEEMNRETPRPSPISESNIGDKDTANSINPITRSLFDDVCETIEGFLANYLFEDFFKSFYCKKYQEKVSLKTGLNEMNQMNLP